MYIYPDGWKKLSSTSRFQVLLFSSDCSVRAHYPNVSFLPPILSHGPFFERQYIVTAAYVCAIISWVSEISRSTVFCMTLLVSVVVVVLAIVVAHAAL